MNRINSALLLILVIQVFLAAVVYWPQQAEIVADPAAPLLAIDPAAVTGIQLADEQGNEAFLQRIDGRWQLPLRQELPADSALIERLLRVLTREQHGYPVATSIAARQRFEVASYRFQRRVTLTGSDDAQLGTVFLGTAPAFRRIHARNDAADAIYSIAFNSFDAPARDADWLDRRLLQVPQPRSIQGPGFAVAQTDSGDWRTFDGATPEPRELEALLGSLANLQVDGIASDDQQRSLAEAAPAFSVSVATAAGERNLTFYLLEEEHFVHDPRYDLFFSISAYDFDRLNTLDSERLNGRP
ncbi:DUF4340 domain-containing protein [Haliea sp. E1-2-M8]|uniref:DUF4340 domain-containing protein n=1 Tax=Haliea sp. E1-2-M8 TaxID=3064706 RepID=UPI00271ECC94|nr:DUF4340 domain-containing protein [Haliea sp. E1-2-M8]MDO8860274.1 DUF4340 domain-containing protein [Haliea sp. E1-2-M8]